MKNVAQSRGTRTIFTLVIVALWKVSVLVVDLACKELSDSEQLESKI